MSFGVPSLILITLLALISGGIGLIIWLVYRLTSKKR